MIDLKGTARYSLTPGKINVIRLHVKLAMVEAIEHKREFTPIVFRVGHNWPFMACIKGGKAL